MKKTLCFVFVCLLVVLPFSLTAYAYGPEDILIEFMVDAIFSFGKSANDNVKSMDGDEFYNFWYNKDNFNTAGWRGLYSALASRPGLDGAWVRDNTLLEPLGMMIDSHYNKLSVNADILDRIVDIVNNGGVVDSFKFEDYGFETFSNVVYLEYTSFGVPLRPNAASESTFGTWGGYFPYQIPSDNDVSFIHCPGMPPSIYVGASTTVYHCGHIIPAGHYFIADDKTLVPAPYFSSGSVVSWREVENNLYGSLIAGGMNPYQVQDDNHWYWYYSTSQIDHIYVDGSSVNLSAGDSLNLSVYQAMSMRIGAYLTSDDHQPVSVPDDIPYDDDGNVIMLIPEGGGDVVYMSPTDYDNYINNGTIVEGDFINNYSDETINNIKNIIFDPDSDSGSGGGSSFDDSRILGKLDVIIDWLRKIHDKIDFSNIVKPSFPDLFDFLDVEPCYTNFSDCLGSNTLYHVVNDSIRSANDQLSSGDLVLAQNSVIGSAVRPPGFDDDYSATNGAIDPTRFNRLYRLDVSWYSDYRDQVHQVLRLVAYALGLYSLWRSFKSVFGISIDFSV